MQFGIAGFCFSLFAITVATPHAAVAQTLLKSFEKSIAKVPERKIPVSATFNERSLQKPVPPDFHTKHFGFFCRQELKLQRANVPVTFRIGTMEQCDKLEQKTANINYEMR
ncbi:MAG: hypothetical protein K9G49_06915 [Taibaiella sp.]|nr:hypothetical protein [Taibaiella sp.]